MHFLDKKKHKQNTETYNHTKRRRKMSTAIVPARNQNLLRHDRRSMLSDDTALRKQIQATHAYDDHSIDIESILVIVNDIFNLVSPGIDGIINVRSSNLAFSFSFSFSVIS